MCRYCCQKLIRKKWFCDLWIVQKFLSKFFLFFPLARVYSCLRCDLSINHFEMCLNKSKNCVINSLSKCQGDLPCHFKIANAASGNQQTAFPTAFVIFAQFFAFRVNAKYHKRVYNIYFIHNFQNFQELIQWKNMRIKRGVKTQNANKIVLKENNYFWL